MQPEKELEIWSTCRYASANPGCTGDEAVGSRDLHMHGCMPTNGELFFFRVRALDITIAGLLPRGLWLYQRLKATKPSLP
jgi:hypothetical protein